MTGMNPPLSTTGGKDAADERWSDFGPFPVADEDAVLERLFKDIEREALGTLGVLTDYAGVVADAERRLKAEHLLKHVADSGGAANLGRLIEVLYFAGRQGLLRKYSLRFPSYNILDEFFVGSIVPQGPRLVSRPRPARRQWRLFGRAIDFPIGIPASVLTSNYEWVTYFFRQGYSVLTTRTVRSRFKLANEQPNWVFVPSMMEAVPLGEPLDRVVADPSDWVDAGSAAVTTSNSFGVPSYEPEIWQEDLRDAIRQVQDGQLLIVSVMGDIYDTNASAEEARSARTADFVTVAQMAVAAGAEFIELNLSCPNSLKPDRSGVQPPLCEDLEATVEVIRAVRESVPGSVRLIAKLSYLSEAALRDLLLRVGSHIDGVAGINTVQTEVVTRSGEETFPGRARAGVSGTAVRHYGLDFVRSLARLRIELDLSFEILGMGGVTDEHSFREMYEAGASVVQSASGVFANPFLAFDCIRLLGSELPDERPLLGDEGMKNAVKTRLESFLPRADDDIANAPDEFDAAIRLALPGNEALAVVQDLLDEGFLVRAESGGVLLSS